MSIKSEIQGFDISGKSAVIVGCGGLGTNASVHRAGTGISRLLLIDFDTVEERNLNRQFFYTKEDTGSEKPACLRRGSKHTLRKSILNTKPENSMTLLPKVMT